MTSDRVRVGLDTCKAKSGEFQPLMSSLVEVHGLNADFSILTLLSFGQRGRQRKPERRGRGSPEGRGVQCTEKGLISSFSENTSSFGPNTHRTRDASAHKLEHISFDVASVQCEYSH